jgi:hypothetical protein
MDIRAASGTTFHHHGAKAPSQTTMPTTSTVSPTDSIAANYLSGSKVNVLM